MFTSDSESSAAGYSSPDDDDYNTDDHEIDADADADDDDELLLDKKNRAIEEGFSLQASNSGSSPATPAGKYDHGLSTQPASQSATKQQQQRKRKSPRRKASPGITSTIVDVIRGEANYSIPKKMKFQQQAAFKEQHQQQQQQHQQQHPIVPSPAGCNPTQTQAQTQQQRQKQPPMKKRKVSLSPTDSLARHRKIGEIAAGVVIDLLADDDDDDEKEALLPKPSNSNTLSPVMLVAANKQQKEHVAATKLKNQTQNSTLEYTTNSTKEKKSSKGSVISYTATSPNKSAHPKNKNSVAKQKVETVAKKSSKVSGISYAAPSPDKTTPPKATVVVAAAADDVAAPTGKTKKSRKVVERKRKRKADQTAAASAIPATTVEVSNVAEGTTSSAAATVTATKSKAAENNTKVTKTAKRKDNSVTTAVKPSQTKKKKKKRATFEDELLQNMVLSCKPYNMKDLIQLMGKTTSEASVNFCLLSLIDKGWVIKKEFKSGTRTKELYWANQESKDKKLWALECLQLPDMATIRETRMELGNLQHQHKRFAKEIVTVEQTPSNEQLSILVRNAQKEADDLSAGLEAMKSRISSGSAPNQGTTKSKLGANRFGGRAGGLIHSKTKQQNNPAKKATPLKLKKRINAMRDHWIKRKRKCMDFVDALADGMEKKVKDVVKKVLELETDEDENATIPPKYAV